jgi:hypothetical protein
MAKESGRSEIITVEEKILKRKKIPPGKTNLLQISLLWGSLMISRMPS